MKKTPGNFMRIGAAFAALFIWAAAAPAAADQYRVCAWNEGDKPSIVTASALGALHEVSMVWYQSLSTGHIAGSGEDLSLVAEARDRGLKVLASVSNFNRQGGYYDAAIPNAILQYNYLQLRQIDYLTILCTNKGYDGIDLDWQNLYDTDRDRYTRFVTALADRLHQNGKILSITIHPKTSEPGHWRGARAQDWAALGAVVDEFKLLTYAYSGPWSSPGPFSPLTWMDSVVSFAETLVPASKIMMGVSFGGMDWNGIPGHALSWTQSLSLIAAINPVITVHSASNERTFTYWDASAKPHTVFYHDRAAVKSKLQVLLDGHPQIGGIHIWKMGGEDPAFWDETASQLGLGPQAPTYGPYKVCGWNKGDKTSVTTAAGKAALHEISMVYYYSLDTGNIYVRKEDLTVVTEARNRGLKVLASITNYNWTKNIFDPEIPKKILASSSLQTKHITELNNLCAQRGYDGIDLDWESMYAADRDRFSGFVQALAAKLHQNGRILSIAVHPKVSEPGNWTGPQSQDWAALGAAVDQFKIMTYAYSGTWSGPGPITPMKWLDDVLTHAEDLVPASKIVMGLAFYGQDWYGTTIGPLVWTQTQTIIATYNPVISVDAASGEATFKYVDKSKATHTVFYHDRQAIRTKISVLTNQHPRIAGIHIWRMGGEDPGFWDEIREDLKT